MRRPGSLGAVLGFLLGVGAVAPAHTADRIVVGGELEYKVRRGDTLAAIGARFAIDAGSLAKRNGLAPNARLAAGRVLAIDNRHIVPAVLEHGIVINLPQRLLFHFENGRLAAWYPVGLGQPGTWQTPSGSYRVVSLEENPVWNVPDSIQEEMRRNRERVRTRVPPGTDNPLGRHWIGLSLTCCGIHGTIDPQSVYRFQSHGCIRLAPQHAKELFSRVAVGTPVEIIYEPVLMARDANGNVFLEVHPDVYGLSKDQTPAAEAIAYGRDLLAARESPCWKETIRNEEGIAVPLFLRNEPPTGTERIESTAGGDVGAGAGLVLSDLGSGAAEVRPGVRSALSESPRLPSSPTVAFRCGDGDSPRARAGITVRNARPRRSRLQRHGSRGLRRDGRPLEEEHERAERPSEDARRGRMGEAGQVLHGRKGDQRGSDEHPSVGVPPRHDPPSGPALHVHPADGRKGSLDLRTLAGRGSGTDLAVESQQVIH